MKNNIGLIGIPADFAARVEGGAESVKQIRKILDSIPQCKISDSAILQIPDPAGTCKSGPKKMKEAGRVIQLSTEVMKTVSEFMTEGYFPLVVSGDHSNIHAVLAGMKASTDNSRLGLVYFDAHLDMHTPESSPSGNMHGMPLGATLKRSLSNSDKSTEDLWNSWSTIAGEGKILNPEDIVCIGIRSYEEEEREFADQAGVSIYNVDSLNTVGPDYIASLIRLKLSNCTHVCVSLDIDVFDPEIMPATGSPEENGMSLQNVQDILNDIYGWDNFSLMDITEFNPCLDIDDRGQRLMENILEEFVKFLS